MLNTSASGPSICAARQAKSAAALQPQQRARAQSRWERSARRSGRRCSALEAAARSTVSKRRRGKHAHRPTAHATARVGTSAMSFEATSSRLSLYRSRTLRPARVSPGAARWRTGRSQRQLAVNARERSQRLVQLLFALRCLFLRRVRLLVSGPTRARARSGRLPEG